MNLATKFGIMPSGGELWLNGWSYGKKITIPAANIDADLTNFPLPVYLDNTNFDFTKAKADGSDIRFTDKNLTHLKFERKEHTPTQIPTMTSNTAPLGVASGTGISATYLPWKAFDKNNVYPNTALLTTGVVLNKCVNYTFVKAIKPATYSIIFTFNHYNPSWGTTPITVGLTIQGSNDNSTWTDLITGLSATSVAGTSLITDRIFSGNISTEIAYSQYRCIISSGTFNFDEPSGGGLGFTEMQITGSANSAVYNVQVPTVTDATDTEVYMWYGNASAYNASMEAHQDMTGKALTYNGNVKLVTGVQTGKRVASFDGTGDYFTLGGQSDFAFGTGDFCIEFNIKPSSVADNKFLFASGTTGEFFFGFGGGTSTLGIGRASVAWDSYATHGMSINNEYNVTVTRSGTSLRFFVNGTQVGTTLTNSISYPFANTAYIASQAAAAYYTGSIYGLRITKGRARYTTNFTPPTTFTIDGSDVVLCTNFDTIYDANYVMVQHMGTSLVDASGNNNSGTATGTTVVDTAYGKARSFNGTSDVIATPSKYNASEGTITLLNNPLDGVIGDLWVADDGGGYSGFGYSTSTNAQFGIYDTSSKAATSISPEKNGFNTFTGRYQNGEAISLTVGITKYTGVITGNIGNVATPLKFGKNGPYYPLMILAEVRLSNIARSDAWIKAESLGLKNTLLKIENVYEVLADITVQSAVTTVDFTGLNLGKGDEVMLVCDIENTSGDVSLYVNNNTTVTNYYCQTLGANGSGTGATRYNASYLRTVVGNNQYFIKIKLTNSGYFIAQSESMPLFGTSGIRLDASYITSTFTSTSITQLTVTCTTASGILTGSRFQLYKIGRAI